MHIHRGTTGSTSTDDPETESDGSSGSSSEHPKTMMHHAPTIHFREIRKQKSNTESKNKIRAIRNKTIKLEKSKNQLFKMYKTGLNCLMFIQ